MKFLIAFLLLSFPAAAQTALSGDTVNLNGTVFRLWGIYAPGIGQSCANGWPAGKASADHLGELIRGHVLVCEPVDAEHSGPPSAICKADSRDVAAAMVSAGMAWARLSEGQRYV